MQTLWLKFPFIYEISQKLFNGNLWEKLRQKFGIYSQEHIIDLACGTGDFRKYLQPVSYLGIDINPAYIHYAQKAFSDSHTQFLLADITKSLPFNQGATVFFISAGHHLSDKQLHNLLKLLSYKNPHRFIFIDDMPVGLLAKPLTFLDAILGGGHYFRSEKQISQIIKPYFRIVEKGTLTVKFSCYQYPYVVAGNKSKSS